MKLFCTNSYCNPDDPRDFIFASSTNDRLGVLPNLARGRAKRIWRQFAIPFALVLLSCLLLYLHNRAFYPLFSAVLLGGLWIRSRYFKRLAEEELSACPGPRGPRDGVGQEASAERVVRQAMGLVSILLVVPIFLVVTGITVIERGLPPKNEIVAMLFALLLMASFCSLLVGGFAFYLRARGRMRWVLLMFGMIGFPVSVLVLKSNLLDRQPAELSEGELLRLESEGALVRIGSNPARYVGVKNGEKRYYVLVGDTLKTISVEEAYAK